MDQQEDWFEDDGWTDQVEWAEVDLPDTAKDPAALIPTEESESVVVDEDGVVVAELCGIGRVG